MAHELKYLRAYPDDTQAKVRSLIEQNRLDDYLLQKYPSIHDVRSDKALHAYVIDLKNEYMRRSPPLSKVAFDNKLRIIQHALGTHTRISRVQGAKLKNKREIKIASLFKEVPLPMLRMIAVHELAHLKESEHNKAFYKLCSYMEEDYHQLEFDLRLYLTWQDLPDEDKEHKSLWSKT